MWKVIALIVVACVFILFIIIAYLMESKRLPKKIQRFSGRERLTLDEIYRSFYADSGIGEKKISELWVKIANILQLDAGKLRPTDQFDVELRPVEGHLVEDELVELNYFLRDECINKGIPIPKAKLKTLDELIRLLTKEGKGM
ncbi:MAG: hypothetical protein ACYST3_05495 [Planctomycetota bacterium]|jgi:hypothetical protein